MEKKGKPLERLVAAIHHAESKGGVVTWNDVIEGRQFDVTVRFKYGLHDYLTVIECKDYGSKIPVEKVDALVTKARDANANKAVLVSTTGFQSGCAAVAERNGIELLVINERTTESVGTIAERMSPALKVENAVFTLSGGGTYELEDWGGRLHYLMLHSRILATGGVASPESLIARWQRANPLPAQPETVPLDLPPGSILYVPYEGERHVSRFTFKCSVIDVRFTSAPILDSHIRDGIDTQVELSDLAGNVRHSIRKSAIPLGFDGTIKPGQFYEQPAFKHRYHCDGIDGDMVTWSLVESYQHGQLFQATYMQKTEYSGQYVLVSDPAVITRLKLMLGTFRQK
ncbi:MAG: restriction endonuclease [Panacagrimonas sp.]|nr:restriction endonuclease [Panacagrimonas sp.]MCC2657083.1 restriction endonuclease [Panacagrimonas sp.]